MGHDCSESFAASNSAAFRAPAVFRTMAIVCYRPFAADGQARQTMVTLPNVERCGPKQKAAN